MTITFKRLLGILILVSLSATSVANEPPKQPPKENKPVEVIMATTDDGRRVILMPDGKWSFVQAAPSSAPTPAPAPQSSCRDQIWSDVVSYFSGWEFDQVNKDSYLIQTKWTVIKKTGLLYLYRMKVMVLVNADCSLKIDSFYQQHQMDPNIPNMGWLDESLEIMTNLAKVPVLGIDAKNALEFDKKLKDNLNSIAAKYKK